MWHKEYVIEDGLYNHNASETLVKDVLKKISGLFSLHHLQVGKFSVEAREKIF